jgi:hypothetical protein
LKKRYSSSFIFNNDEKICGIVIDTSQQGAIECGGAPFLSFILLEASATPAKHQVVAIYWTIFSSSHVMDLRGIIFPPKLHQNLQSRLAAFQNHYSREKAQT